MQPLRVPAAVLLTIGLVALPAPRHALSRVDDDEALARASAAAVRGLVTAVHPAWDAAAGAIYTRVSIAVDRAWGLAAAPPQVALKLLGGAIGETALVVGGQARFAVGEQVLAFLDVRPRDGSLSVTGLERGKWTLGAGAPATAVRGATDQGQVATRDVRTLADLERLAALAGGHVRVDGARARPSGPAVGTLGEDGAWRDAGAGRVPAAAIVARWHEADEGVPVPVDSAYGGHPLFPHGGLAQFMRALTAWSEAGPLQLTAGVVRSGRCFGNDESPDGRISVSYDDPCGEIADTSPVIAIGGAYYSSTDVRDVNGTPFWKITKGMVVLDDVLPKFAAMSTGCYEELLTHELGHAIGLSHTSIGPAVMAPTLSTACISRTESLGLQAPDLDALGMPYPPAPAVPGPPGTPTGLSARVDGHRVALQWVGAPGAAATAYHLLAGSLPGATDYGAVAVSVPSFTAPQVGAGVYYVRVVAVNADGASAPTADVAVVVGAGLPGPPTGVVAAGGPGGAVRVRWNAPAGAAPTGYVLLAGHAPGTLTARFSLRTPWLIADRVAPGTYYLRVAAMNAVGRGPVSPEITVVVP